MTDERRALHIVEGPPEIDVPPPRVIHIDEHRLRRGERGGAEAAEPAKPGAPAASPVPSEPPEVTRAKRAFLRRAAGYLAVDAGIRQFVDIGSRVPLDEGIGRAVHGHAPDARVVYIETGSTLPMRGCASAGEETVSVASMHRPDPVSLISLLELRGFVDFGEPVAFFLVDTDAPQCGDVPTSDLVRALHGAMCPGGCVAIALPPGPPGHTDITVGGETTDHHAPTDDPHRRQRAESVFSPFTLLDPGLADLAWWPYPDEAVAARGTGIRAGVGRR
ncbi:SAM-dependent methyltransferase [Nocardiopsis gilva]|uniref:SAM-dependent methyltransferase n=2 Tax=Nocardiopsis gilva TaxID=280236 RepID=UPI0012FD8427|nr:SAM-dependent methyltransferase [Nocardiopsis gilva]